MKEKKERLLTFILVFSYLLIALVIFRKVLFLKGMLGLHDDWGIPPLPAQYLSLIDNNKYSWVTPYLGSMELRGLANYFTIFLWPFASFLHLGGEFLSKYLYILFIFLGGVFFYLFARKSLKISPAAAYLSGLVYMLSPFVFNSVVSGYLMVLVSYAFLPLFFLFYLEILNKKEFNFKKIIIAGIILRVVFTQDFFILLAGILIFSYLLFESIFPHKTWREKLLNFSQTIAVVLIAFLLTGSFFLIMFSNFAQTSSFAQEQIVSWNTFVAPNLFRAFSLDGAGYRYFLDSIPKTLVSWWSFVNFLIVIAGFSTLLLARKKKLVLYFSFLILFSLFIFKGINSPFEQINYLLIAKLPLVMVLLRNVQYITVLTVFGYAALFGFFLHWLVFSKGLDPKLFSMLFASILLLLAINAHPYFTGDFGGNIQVYKLDDSYRVLDNKLRQEKEDYRIYWLPPSQPLAYKNSKFAGNDPMVYGSAKSFVGNGAPHPIEEILAQNFYTGENLNLQNILSFLGIKKIIYRDDFTSWLPNFKGPDFQVFRKYWTNQSLKTTLVKLSAVEAKEKIGNSIEVYNNKYFLPHFYVPKNLIYLQGDLKGLMDIGSLSDYQIRSGIFLDENGDEKDKEELINRVNEVIVKGQQKDKEELNYLLTVPQEGNYQLLIGGFQPKSPNNTWIDFDGVRINLGTMKLEEGGWWSLPERYLTKGEHKLFVGFENWLKVPSVLLRSTKDISQDIPKITFLKINQTKYKVKIEGAKDPYILVFSEGFHSGWKAYISDQRSVTSGQYGEVVASYFDGDIKEGTHKNIFLAKNTFETWGKKPIPEEQHFLVNSYANSWYITSKDADGSENYEIIIEFWPQRLFYFGVALSLITLFSSLGYLLFSCSIINKHRLK